jgi:hypothetical protein
LKTVVLILLRVEVLTAVAAKCFVSWDIMPCIQVEVCVLSPLFWFLGSLTLLDSRKALFILDIIICSSYTEIHETDITLENSKIGQKDC